MSAQELPQNDTTVTGNLSNLSQLCVRFAEEIVQNIFNSIDQVPLAIKTFLIDIIANTKEGDAGVLSLADAYVLTGFFIQKWIAFGFRWCLSQLRQ